MKIKESLSIIELAVLFVVVVLFILPGFNSLLLAPSYAANASSSTTFGSSASIDISAAKSIAKPPAVANSGDDVYVTYAQATPKEGTQMYFQVITNSGTTIGTKTLISSGIGTEVNDFQRIAAVGSYVYVTWQYVTSNNLDESIMFRASSNDGSTWGPLQNLSKLAGTEVTCPGNTGTGLCAQPTIAASGSYVYVSWTQQGSTKKGDAIYFTTSSNNGGIIQHPC